MAESDRWIFGLRVLKFKYNVRFLPMISSSSHVQIPVEKWTVAHTSFGEHKFSRAYCSTGACRTLRINVPLGNTKVKHSGTHQNILGAAQSTCVCALTFYWLFPLVSFCVYIQVKDNLNLD